MPLTEELFGLLLYILDGSLEGPSAILPLFVTLERKPGPSVYTGVYHSFLLRK